MAGSHFRKAAASARVITSESVDVVAVGPAELDRLVVGFGAIVSSDGLFMKYSFPLPSGALGRDEWATAEIEFAATCRLPGTGKGCPSELGWAPLRF